MQPRSKVSKHNNYMPYDTGKRKAANINYFSPLQTTNNDNDNIDDDNVEETTTPPTPEAKTHVPPITIIKCRIEQVHELCKSHRIDDYAIKKISIGFKLFCRHKVDYFRVCDSLKGKFQFFSYAYKEDKPYKAVLLGLDKLDPNFVKNQLVEMGIACTDVKLVEKKYDMHFTQYIYIVYFKRQSISVNDLRKNYSVIDHVKVKWDHQKHNPGRITQCYKCQMFGHGSNHCHVQPYCSNCAGTHHTSNCTEPAAKCANCNGPHPASSKDCPARQNYINLKQRYQRGSAAQRQNNYSRGQTQQHNISAHNNPFTDYDKSFPNHLAQDIPTDYNAWSSSNNTGSAHQNGQSSCLFSIEEIKKIMLDLINNLRKCKNKVDQLDVVTNLAFKFLS